MRLHTYAASCNAYKVRLLLAQLGRDDVEQVEHDIFAGATLSYKEFITLDATLRRDRSSTLPTKNNTYYYPSVSGNFVFSRLLPDWTWMG